MNRVLVNSRIQVAPVVGQLDQGGPRPAPSPAITGLSAPTGVTFRSTQEPTLKQSSIAKAKERASLSMGPEDAANGLTDMDFVREVIRHMIIEAARDSVQAQSVLWSSGFCSDTTGGTGCGEYPGR